MRHSLLVAPLLLALLAGARAEELKLYRANEAIDPQEVARILATPKQPAIKMRSLRLLDDGPAAALAEAQPAPEAQRPALALPVHFSFDSAEVAPSARPQLDALVEGIRLLPSDAPVVIEGHTDSIGSEAYNESLSQRRAQAVKDYLVAQGIAASRLRVLGRGEHAPLPGRDPQAAENRRVQFRGD